MATKRKKSTKKSSATTETTTRVTRISASDEVPPLEKVKAKRPAKPDADTKDMPSARKKSRRNPLRAILDYFKGSWYEIRQVRWPTRVTTWKMTVALLLFTGAFVVVILLLDWLFQLLFNQLLG